MLAPMRRLSLLLLVPLALAVAGCGGDDDGATGGTTRPEARATAVITTAEGEVELSVEVADDDAERARGLMFRTSLPENDGMVFLFPEATAGAFWMKDTLIPLSIAFFDAEGRILRILHMEPCRADPCPLYDPEVPFSGALEVNRGAFERLNVREGDRIELRGIAASPAALTTTSSA
jgi:uncharacterized membrane protein (UPF0127 family)